MRVGVVGTGSIGRRHIGNLLALGAEVVAMDVSTEARSRAEVEHPHAKYLPALPLRNLDALVIATPIQLHLPWVEEAIARRIPFFVEKSIGTIEQLPRWRELVARDLPVNQVGYNLRFHPELIALRDFVPAADAGGFYCDCDMSSWPGASYGSALLECSHELDAALWCGAPATVSACQVQRDGSGDVWLGEQGRWLFSFDAHSVSYVRHWTLASGVRRDVTVKFLSPAELGVEMYRAEMAHFLDCVREQKPTICPLSDGLKVLEVCRQVMEAA